MQHFPNRAWTDGKFVEVLQLEDGTPFGYRFLGSGSGPQLAVAGDRASLAPVFDALREIPSLPWMRGAIVLVDLDTLARARRWEALDGLGPIDRTVTLPFDLDHSGSARLKRRICNHVLGVAASLGMIAGRGVFRPRRPEVDRFA